MSTLSRLSLMGEKGTLPAKLTAIIQPTFACNLSCRYCYLSDLRSKDIMNQALLESVMAQVLQVNDRDVPTEFIWHGGEPLLAGLDFFQKVVEIQKTKLCQYDISNCVQTNGTLMTEPFISFFKEHDFHVGVSLDGPKDVHDANRKYANGRGSFEVIIRNLEKAKEYALRVGALCVLTQTNVHRVEEIYEFFKALRLGFSFEPVTPTATMGKIFPPLSLNNEDYAEAAIRFFDLWFFDDNPVAVRPLVTLAMSVLLGSTSGECTFSGRCIEEYISIDPLGNVYPCNRFSGLPAFMFGNLNDTRLKQVLTSPRRVELCARQESTSIECHDCEVYELCNGGCPHQARIEGGKYSRRDYFCPAYKLMFKHAMKRVNEQLAGATTDEPKTDCDAYKKRKEEVCSRN